MNSSSLPSRPDYGNRNRFARHPVLTGIVLLLASAAVLEEIDVDPGSPDEGRGRVSKEALLRYTRILRERGVPLLVLSHFDSRIERDLHALCRANGIESHPLVAPEKLLRPDRHFNRTGNEELARFVAGLLERRGVVPTRGKCGATSRRTKSG